MLITLDGAGPRYAQITRALRNLIQSGGLPFDARLPPTRELARDLNCSRNIVLLAYEQLVLEGYLVSRQGAGTFVSPAWPRSGRDTGPVAAKAVPMRVSSRGRQMVDAAEKARAAMARRPGLAIDFMYGLCDPDPRVVARLRAAFNSALRSRTFRYGPPTGDPELRQQVVDRIRGSRGITCTPDQIVITNGAQQALDICVRLLLDPGDRMVVEDPGYASAHAVFIGAGATLVRVPVDSQGLDPETLPRDGKSVRAVYVTPSHQFPTGAVMPAARRYALIDWARRRGAYIIEDDYDGEYRYAGQPVAALAALEPHGRVIYCGTFAKSLFPSLRLAYLVVPPGLAHALVHAKWLSDLGSSALLQHALAQLMATGEYDRHIRRMQKHYRSRRQVLLGALKRHLGDAAGVVGASAGLHVVLWFTKLPPERVTSLVDACAARGVGVYPIGGHATRRLRHAGLILGYGLTEATQIERGIELLAAAYQEISAMAPPPRRAAGSKRR
jgi:GntR family transcriptional regulator/MocR family aminotransferase